MVAWMTIAVLAYLPRPTARKVLEAVGTCRGCQLYHPDAAKLYVVERKDGPGSTLHSLIYALGAAARNRMNFGGVVMREEPHIFKGMNVTAMVVTALGITEPHKFFLKRADSVFHRTFSKLTDMERYIAREGALRDGERFLLSGHSMVKEGGVEGVREDRPDTQLDEYLTPRLLGTLRGCALPWDVRGSCRQNREGGLLDVVMHARRGDRAGTADREFFRVTRLIREIAPKASIRVYSLNEGFNKSAFVANGLTTHTDDIRDVGSERLFDVWTIFALADVLVVDTSSFSWAPAFFNSNCVIYHPYHLHYASDRLALSSWVASTDEAGVLRCVSDQIHRTKRRGTTWPWPWTMNKRKFRGN